MTGPGHDFRAEELLVVAGSAQDQDDTTHVLAITQVHATLALATAVNSPAGNRAWVDVAGTKAFRHLAEA